MPLPDTFYVEQGTAIVWGEAGGSGVTNTLSLDDLADGKARMGESVDLGAEWNREYLVILQVETGTAPTAGRTVDCYLVSSHNGTTWPGGVTGSDSLWPSDDNEDEWSPQLGNPATTLVATNDGNVVQTQNAEIWRPKGRYVAPVTDNNLGVAFRDQATASNNLSRVILIPIIEKVKD